MAHKTPVTIDSFKRSLKKQKLTDKIVRILLLFAWSSQLIAVMKQRWYAVEVTDSKLDMEL